MLSCTALVAHPEALYFKLFYVAISRVESKSLRAHLHYTVNLELLFNTVTELVSYLFLLFFIIIWF